MKWWRRSCPAEERERELNQMMFTALETESEKTVLSILRSRGQSFPHDLKDAVNLSLRENGARGIFTLGRQRLATGIVGSNCGSRTEA
jgi:hypothetical protein